LSLSTPWDSFGLMLKPAVKPVSVAFSARGVVRTIEVGGRWVTVHGDRNEGELFSETADDQTNADFAFRRVANRYLNDDFDVVGGLPRFGAPTDPRDLVDADDAVMAGDQRALITTALHQFVTAQRPEWRERWAALAEAQAAVRSSDAPAQVKRYELGVQCTTTGDLARTLDEATRAGALEFVHTVNASLGLVDPQPLLDTLGSGRVPRLRALRLSSDARSLGDFKHLLVACPRLRSLQLTGADFSAGSNSVQQLLVQTPKYLDDNAIAVLKSKHFQQLRTLGLEVRVPEDFFGWLLSGKFFPELRTLRLQLSFADATSRLIPLLARKSAKLPPSLERLDLLGRFDYSLLKELRRAAPLLKKLSHIGIGISRSGVQFGRLIDLLPQVEWIGIDSLW